MNKEKILELIDERSKILDIDYNDDKADEIKDIIVDEFRTNFDKYEVDFIIETLTKFGDAPCVMYDDNGMFAVSGDGYQPVVIDDERIEGDITVYVSKEQWFKTIRESLRYYIFDNYGRSL